MSTRLSYVRLKMKLGRDDQPHVVLPLDEAKLGFANNRLVAILVTANKKHNPTARESRQIHFGAWVLNQYFCNNYKPLVADVWQEYRATGGEIAIPYIHTFRRYGEGWRSGHFTDYNALTPAKLIEMDPDKDLQSAFDRITGSLNMPSIPLHWIKEDSDPPPHPTDRAMYLARRAVGMQNRAMVDKLVRLNG